MWFRSVNHEAALIHRQELRSVLACSSWALLVRFLAKLNFNVCEISVWISPPPSEVLRTYYSDGETRSTKDTCIIVIVTAGLCRDAQIPFPSDMMVYSNLRSMKLGRHGVIEPRFVPRGITRGLWMCKVLVPINLRATHGSAILAGPCTARHPQLGLYILCKNRRVCSATPRWSATLRQAKMDDLCSRGCCAVPRRCWRSTLLTFRDGRLCQPGRCSR